MKFIIVLFSFMFMSSSVVFASGSDHKKDSYKKSSHSSKSHSDKKKSKSSSKYSHGNNKYQSKRKGHDSKNKGKGHYSHGKGNGYGHHKDDDNDDDDDNGLSDLKARVLVLETSVTNIQNDITNLQVEVTTNGANITQINILIAQNTTLITNLQQQIDALTISIASKQNAIVGQCAAGEAISSISSDGTIVCAAISESAIYTRVFAQNEVGTNFAIASCPESYTLTGGGYIDLTPGVCPSVYDGEGGCADSELHTNPIVFNGPELFNTNGWRAEKYAPYTGEGASELNSSIDLYSVAFCAK